ncbi:FG-nucleoporin nsp1 [Malassezia vespertilionis]|uniref:FG-nucleoporin nsp1 n=1 Tax=Malassezia vespertilionis TaxID=2020962 RepID=UPI0024B25424|nr:FG-nucleoporin nsp1 [Malassezia vespertilionis]WFD08195.1 FG-nucleoporin nsp1 [Malassezia vespertilionis]
MADIQRAKAHQMPRQEGHNLPPGSLFGAKPSEQKPTGALVGDTENAAAKPANGPSLGNPPAAFTGTGASGGFSFGAKPGGSDASMAAEAPKPAGFSFGGNAKPAEAPKPGGFSFGGNDAKPAEAPKPAGFSFGGNDAKPAEAPKPAGFSFGSNDAKPAEAPKPAGAEAGGFRQPQRQPPSCMPPAEAPKPAGFSFGSNDAKPAEAPKPAGFSFGGNAKPAEAPKPGGFSFGGNDAKPAEAPKPAGFSFGGNDAKPAEAPKPAGFSFGSNDAKPAEAPKPAGFSFGSNDAKPAEAPKPAGFSFGADASKQAAPSLFGAKPTDTNNANTAPSTAHGATNIGFSTDKAPTSTTSAPANNAFTSTSLSFAKPTETKPDASTTTMPSSKPSATPAPSSTAAPSMLRGKSVEEIVKMWQTELDASAKEFGRQADEVAGWDRVLLNGGDEISKLVASITQAEERQLGIDQTLDYVEQQQTELNTLLDAYESQRGELHAQAGAGRGVDVGVADIEREKSYTLAENLNAQLDDMSRNLVSMIDEVNQLASPSGTRNTTADASPNSLDTLRTGGRELMPGAEDPILQISGILNAHLSSLKWIDEHTVMLRDRLEALRRGKTEKNMNDSFRGSVPPQAPRSSTPSRYAREGSAAPGRARTLAL